MSRACTSTPPLGLRDLFKGEIYPKSRNQTKYTKYTSFYSYCVSTQGKAQAKGLHEILLHFVFLVSIPLASYLLLKDAVSISYFILC